MAAIHLASAIGGDAFLGFVSAVAFATILAVVAGLTLSGASALSHDIYASVVKGGNADPGQELKVSRMTVPVLALLAIGLGIAFEKQNVAFMVSLAFSLAASGNFPVLLMSVFWRGCTTRGVVAGGIVGVGLALILTIASPVIWGDVLGNGEAFYPYSSPTLFSMPLAFAVIWLVSLTDRSKRATIDRAGYVAQRVRSETGLGASGASSH